MTRTTQAKKNPRNCEKSRDQTKMTTATTVSPNTSTSSTTSTSSSDSIDFLSNPNAFPVPSSNEESDIDSSLNDSTHEMPAYDDKEIVDSPPLPQSPKSPESPKAKSKAKPKVKAQPKPKQNRKQVKPAKRKDRVDRDIQRLRDSTDLLIPKAPFQRLVREIMMKNNNSDETFRVTGQALAALQISAETYLTQLMEDSYLLTLHRHRVTLLPRDIQITLYIRDPHA